MKRSYSKRDHHFGQAMLKLRKDIGLTQERLGKLLGVTGRTISEWETGKIYPNVEHLKALIALALQNQAFPSEHEAEEIRAFWKVAHPKMLLDERWLSTLLSELTSPLSQTALEEPPASKPEEQGGHEPAEAFHTNDRKSLALPALDRVTPSVATEQNRTIQNLPFPPNPFFTGRESLLKDLERLFEHNKRIAVTQPISISGLGGIGKTQLALEYAHRCSPYIYQYVLWVNADDRASLQASYLALAHLLQLPEQQEREVEQIVQAVKNWLEKQTHWLLILDNADDLGLACGFLPTKAQGHILFTTRSQIVGNLATLVQVEAMSPEEGLSFLLRRCGVLKPGAVLENLPLNLRQEASALVELLGGHPLTLDQAGAYLEETREPGVEVCGSSFAEYRQLYQQQRRTLLQKRGWLGREHPDTVATTLEMSLHKACELYPKCAEVLAFCALLHPDAIPEELLREALGLNLDLLQFNEVIRALRRYSLIKRDSEKQMLSLHRLVQAVIKDGMDAQELGQWSERVVQAVNGAFPEVTFEQWPRCERYLPHALVSVSWIEQEAVAPLPTSHLLSKVGTYLRERGQYRDAEPLLARTLAISEQHLGAEHPDTANCLDNLAVLYRQQGKYSLAESLSLRALAIREQQLGAEHPNTAESLRNLAVLYSDQGKYARAEPLYQRALSICEQHLGAEHPKTATCLNNLAILYFYQGKYSLAEPLYQRALAIREQHLGAEHPDTAMNLNNLAIVYSEQGKYARAEPLYQRALAIYEQHLGVEHPDTATSLNNLASLYSYQGKYSLAEPLFWRVLAIREQHLGAEHPDTASSLNNLASLYWLQGKYEQAEPLFWRALAICEQHLGAEHPGTATSLNNLAELYHVQGKHEQAEPLYQRALSIREQRLGPEHPSTAVVLHDLAELYRVQGKDNEALPLYQRALALREKCLGETHPQTQKTREAYAAFLHTRNHA